MIRKVTLNYIHNTNVLIVQRDYSVSRPSCGSVMSVSIQAMFGLGSVKRYIQFLVQSICIVNRTIAFSHFRCVFSGYRGVLAEHPLPLSSPQEGCQFSLWPNSGIGLKKTFLSIQTPVK